MRTTMTTRLGKTNQPDEGWVLDMSVLPPLSNIPSAETKLCQDIDLNADDWLDSD